MMTYTRTGLAPHSLSQAIGVQGVAYLLPANGSLGGMGVCRILWGDTDVSLKEKQGNFFVAFFPPVSGGNFFGFVF